MVSGRKEHSLALKGVAEVSGDLFSHSDIIKALESVTATVVKRFGVDKCFVYGRGMGSFRPSHLVQMALFSKPDSIITASDSECFEFINCEECFALVAKTIKNEGFYEGFVGSDSVMQAISLYKIGYALIFPLLVDGEEWGLFGVHSPVGANELLESQKSALETISRYISWAIEKQLATEQLKSLKLELLCINQNLEAAASKAIEDKLRVEEEKLAQERELFAVRERYHLLQQDDAYHKQLKIIRDELSHKKVGEWVYESHYKPLDILSGDIYGLIKVCENSSLAYIVDAMGKGLSASVTAVVSASFINESVDVMRGERSFSFSKLIGSYQSFIQKQINDDEAVCAMFLHIDNLSGTLYYANFSMPEILCKGDGFVEALHSNNYPITKYYNGFKVGKFSLCDTDAILFFSDGLRDLRLWEGGIYKERIYDDFLSADFKKGFLNRFVKLTMPPDDDLTMGFISRFKPVIDEKHAKTVSPSLEAISEFVERDVRESLGSMLSVPNLSKLEFALNEMLMNALEHGVLGIDCQTKHTLLESFEYDDFLQERLLQSSLDDSKRVSVAVEIGMIKNKKAIIIEIEDCGDGFDASEVLKALELDKNVMYNGRGVVMSKGALDLLFYNAKGNCVTIVKII